MPISNLKRYLLLSTSAILATAFTQAQNDTTHQKSADKSYFKAGISIGSISAIKRAISLNVVAISTISFGEANSFTLVCICLCIASCVAYLLPLFLWL